jgi:hypothetical protein
MRPDTRGCRRHRLLRGAVTTLSVTVLVTVAGFVGVASAKPDPRARAQTIADGLVTPLLSTNGQAGYCDPATKTGTFFDRNRMYLATCSGEHPGGTFVFFAVVRASGGAYDQHFAALENGVAGICQAGGRVYAAGVKGTFASIYGGTGTGVQVARELRDAFAAQLQHTRGHISVNPPC